MHQSSFRHIEKKTALTSGWVIFVRDNRVIYVLNQH